ncbi:MAG TPA: hypothetical protein VKX17_03940 [Planctomycetota bacterium]|nr:hypothetical protein [Planctomycetota bacterium]
MPNKKQADRVSDEKIAYGNEKRRKGKIVIRSREEWEKMDPPFPDESEWALELEADAKRREKEQERK